MVFRIYKGKKTNRFLCLLFLILTLIFLIAAGISVLLKNPEAGCTFCILAIITGGFSLLYGLLWAVYGRTEIKAERKLREILDPQYAPDDPYLPDYQEFVLPKSDLIEKAGNRAGSILRWTGICALCVFLLTGGIQLACGSLKSPLQLLYMLLFCIITYIKANGESQVTERTAASRALGIKPYSTETEAAFMETLNHAIDILQPSGEKYRVYKEVPVSQVFSDNRSYEGLFYTGRFDFVVYERSGRQEFPVLAIELDGKEHFSDDVVKERDRQKNQICKDHNFELIRVENTYARRYHYIKDILISYFAS